MMSQCPSFSSFDLLPDSFYEMHNALTNPDIALKLVMSWHEARSSTGMEPAYFNINPEATINSLFQLYSGIGFVFMKRVGTEKE